LVIQLRIARIDKILGFTIESTTIETLLQHLGFFFEKNTEGWQVTVPVYRPDVTLEIDLIEEIIRLYGYEKLPLHQTIAPLHIPAGSKNTVDLCLLRNSLRSLGYHEVITYSFISEKYQQLFDPAHQPKILMNPITAEMSVMRTNLWPGLVEVLLYNQNRQQPRVRLFEIGLRFVASSPDKNSSYLQQKVISGLVSNTALPEQWGCANRDVDFFDLKGEIETSLGSMLPVRSLHFKPGTHPALHPGQTAEIQYAGSTIGILGALHPNIVQELGISGKVFVFELILDGLALPSPCAALELSKFPAIRRDIAIYVDQTVPSQQIQDTITEEVSGELLKEINVFDVYQGKGVPPGQKSVALALTLQHSSRTLLDEEVADVMDRVISALKQRFAAELRG
jgi:phenylalanyl-tRNA synthetase beta chain